MRLFIAMLLGGWMMSVSASPYQGLEKVGQAKLQVLFWDVYQSTLYAEGGQFTEHNYPVVLEINYLRNIDADDLVEQTEKEWRKLGFDATQYKPWLNELQGLWPDIKKGDTLAFSVDQQGNNTFYFNQAPIGAIDGKVFSDQFLAIWLDENCSYPKLRKQLLGQNK